MRTESYVDTNKTSIKEDNMDIHEKNESTQLQHQKCKFCTSQFQTITEYLAHIEEKHENNKNNNFMCSVCGKQYKTKNELTQHTSSKCGTIKQFACKICNKQLMSAGSLYNHMVRHKGVKSFMCRFCAKLFFTAGQLKVHERIHTQDKAYICEVCNKGFCHRQSLITHSTLHTGIKPYQCETCGNSFSCVGNLIKHHKTHPDTCGLIPLTTHRVKHPSTKIKVKINTPSNSRLKIYAKDKEIQQELQNLKTEISKDINMQSFDSQLDVISQMSYKENTNESNHNLNDDCLLKIKVCSDSNNRDSDVDAELPQELSKNEVVEKKLDHIDNSSLRIHTMNLPLSKTFAKFIKEYDFEKKGYADCRYCNRRYTNVHWFFKHVKNHESNIPKQRKHPSGIPLHKCSCCKMTFYTKEESLVHQQLIHSDILTCHECEKMFANRDSLRSHQKVFHKGVGRKSYIYICEKCGKQFKQKSYLKAHEERNCDKGPFYECSICKKQFSSIYTRNNHMRVHDPEKKLLCKFCRKSFHWKGQLKIHERRHTGEKPFACLYCPKAFAYRESLITHSTLHTGIKPHLCEGCGSRFSCIGNLIKHRSSHAHECGAWNYKTLKQPPLM